MTRREIGFTVTALLVLVVAFMIGMSGTSIWAEESRVIPSPELTESDCYQAGLYPLYVEGLPGSNWMRNGLICVEHVDPSSR